MRGSSVKVTVKVAASGVKATGRVTVTLSGRKQAVKLNGQGQAVVRVRIAMTTKVGAKTLTASYSGSSTVQR